MNLRRFSPGLLLLPFALLALGATAPAQEVRFQWLSSGASPKFGYYAPKRLALSAAKPDQVKKVPDGLASPLYGEIVVGPKESPAHVGVLVDEATDGTQRLWIDRNGNGDLTDDPPALWTARASQRNGKESTMHDGSTRLEVAYPDGKKELEIALYRFDPKQRPEAKTMLLYYRQWGYEGELALGGKTYKAMLDDFDSTGDFRGRDESEKASGLSLLVDVNGDGKFGSRDERFDARKPFNIGGATYELTGFSASGAGLKVIKSDKTVAETKPAAVIRAGGKAVAFEATTTTGQKVKFPDDYRGKAVLLDFWATWCGPCRAELPNLKKVHEELHAKGFEILGVSLDSADTLGKLAAFTAENGMAWPQIADGKGWDAELGRKYNVSAIPAAFLVNGNDGTIVALGNEVRGAQLRPAVEKALAALGGGQNPSTPKTAEPGKEKPKAATPAPVDPLVAKAEALRAAGKLMEHTKFLEQRKTPAPAPVNLPAPATKALAGREVARVAREAHLRPGWFYHCTRCDHWHIKLAGGYAIADDTIATAWHVMSPPENFKEGSPVAVDNEQRLVAVTAVLAADERMDAIVLRVGTHGLKPLPLGDAEVGDAAFCFSDPLQQRNYFSAGIVNRFRLLNDNGASPPDRAEPATLRMNVSTDWAPGSSGAAVLDTYGNIIGHVATMAPLFEKMPGVPQNSSAPQKEDRFHGAALMTLHDAIPAKSIRSLLKRAP